MKLISWRITLGFTLLGFSLGLLDVAMSLLYAWVDNPAFKEGLSSFAYWFLLVCPFALGTGMEVERLHRWSDIAWAYLEMITLNTSLYLMLGLACSFVVTTVKGVIANRPR